MQKATINVYEFSELSAESKQKAMRDYLESSPYHYEPLEEEIRTFIEMKLQEQGYTITGKLEVAYSLSCCQGDGVSFTGDISREGVEYRVVRRTYPRYVHAEMMDVEECQDGEWEEAHNSVTIAIRGIGHEAEAAGYAELEYLESEEVLGDEACLGGSTFYEDGTVFNN